jgi:hypothetical protein
MKHSMLKDEVENKINWTNKKEIQVKTNKISWDFLIVNLKKKIAIKKLTIISKKNLSLWNWIATNISNARKRLTFDSVTQYCRIYN